MLLVAVGMLPSQPVGLHESSVDKLGLTRLVADDIFKRVSDFLSLNDIFKTYSSWPSQLCFFQSKWPLIELESRSLNVWNFN